MANDDDKDKSLQKKLLHGLTEQEKQVLIDRFGLDELLACSKENSNQSYDVTRERIREIEKKALSKLRGKDPDDAA